MGYNTLAIVPSGYMCGIQVASTLDFPLSPPPPGYYPESIILGLQACQGLYIYLLKFTYLPRKSSLNDEHFFDCIHVSQLIN